jgi:hypothetical protein
MVRKFKISSKAGNSKPTESNKGKSETVPDQSMSIREIIDKFAHGVLPDFSHELEYSEDMPDLRGMDISELHNLKREVKQEIKDIEAEIKSRKETPTPPDQTPPPAPENPVEPPKTE